MIREIVLENPGSGFSIPDQGKKSTRSLIRNTACNEQIFITDLIDYNFYIFGPFWVKIINLTSSLHTLDAYFRPNSKNFDEGERRGLTTYQNIF
jgi:hypothetical protein